MTKSVLLYHLYPKNQFRELTLRLLSHIPHNDVFVHVSTDWQDLPRLPTVLRFLRSIPRLRGVFISKNSRFGEIVGFEKFRSRIDFAQYSALTYTHSKGVTKPNNRNIDDWVELMRYFVIERYDLCVDAFARGAVLYGVNLVRYDPQEKRQWTHELCDYHFSGNFVSLNLARARRQFLASECKRHRHGVEGFWGNLVDVEYAYSAHNSNVDHYREPYPASRYKPSADGVSASPAGIGAEDTR